MQEAPYHKTLASLIPASVGASRRHRILAARELKALETEADTLRREVNMWRLGAGRVPMRYERRSASFKSLVNGEMEVDYGAFVDVDLVDMKDGESGSHGTNHSVENRKTLESSSPDSENEEANILTLHSPTSPDSSSSSSCSSPIGFGFDPSLNSTPGEDLFKFYQAFLSHPSRFATALLDLSGPSAY
ncbi:hypothetical protein V5O48_015149 [Marasmius crinis-equi]|uniref:Uncharacterized protein n=1 Tax=Marasmius crinis-equi TaxID=585013 RepID=A0ABR3EVC7_9AGAR